MVLGELIKTKRKTLGITQVQFSKKIGISQGNLSRIETAGVIPSAVVLLKIAHTLKIPTSKIFKTIK